MLATLLLIIHILVAAFICVVILMQSSKGEGLSGAFGLGQGTTSFFGADTANVLVKITAVLAIVFMVTSLSLAYIQARKARTVPLGSAPAGEASMTAPPTEEGEEATPTEGDAGETEAPSATEVGATEAVDEQPGTEPEQPSGESIEPGSGESIEPGPGEPVIEPVEPGPDEPADPATTDS
jgi:preprotein translocase subunit SecG